MDAGAEWRARGRYMVLSLKRDVSSAFIVLEVRGFV